MQQNVLNQGKIATEKTNNNFDDLYINKTNVNSIPEAILEQVLYI